ncbi:MAG TPA: hypothetical protein VHG27_06030 [Xanthobacteraceae bacterium]|nr:hypothetical protein [Xanthobacteraceae bacterium]
MASEALPVERLRAYLRELKPQAQALLVREIERQTRGGSDFPGAHLILEALRPGGRRNAQPEEPIGQPARLFFLPLKPFLIDGIAAARQLPGRIDCASLGPLWSWIGRDLLADAAKSYSEQVSAALLAADTARADALARGFQDLVVGAIDRKLEDASNDERLRRRISAEIAAPRAAEDLKVLVTALRHRNALERIAARTPLTITNLADEQLENIFNLLRRSTANVPDLLLPALIVIMNRLGSFWQLVRLAIRSAESDIAARIARAPFAPAVALVFSQIRWDIEQLRAACREGRIAQAVGVCRELHGAIRALRTEMDLSADSAFGREVGALRGEVSNLLKAEIENTPGRVRRLLRPRPARDVAPGSVLDAIDVAETEARIALVGACRHYAGELAINQIAARVHGELQNSLDAGKSGLLDSLRNAGDADRPFRQSQVDAAVRFAGTLFGGEYASLLAKAATLAAADRKSAKA